MPRTQRVRPSLYQVLESLPGIPASVVGRRLDVLATNQMGRALIADFDQRPHRERNMARYMFLDPDARELYRDWEKRRAAPSPRCTATPAVTPTTPSSPS